MKQPKHRKQCADSVNPIRLSVGEIEALLNKEEDRSIRILPNGEMVYDNSSETAPKPLTIRENLGGEYVQA